VVPFNFIEKKVLKFKVLILRSRMRNANLFDKLEMQNIS